VFAAKLMNFLRNPYSIKKVLNTIGGVCIFTQPIRRFLPITRPYLLERNLIRVSGNQLESVLRNTRRAGRVVHDTLSSIPNEPNMMEGIIQRLSRPRQFFRWSASIGMTEQKTTNDANLGPRLLLANWQEDHLSFSFNLCSYAFITYVFGRLTLSNRQRELHRNWSRNLKSCARPLVSCRS